MVFFLFFLLKGSPRSGLPAHKVSYYPHRHQAGEHPDERRWTLRTEACSWSHRVAEGWGASSLWFSEYEMCMHTHFYICIHRFSTGFYLSHVLFTVSTAPVPKQVQDLFWFFLTLCLDISLMFLGLVLFCFFSLLLNQSYKCANLSFVFVFDRQ